MVCSLFAEPPPCKRSKGIDLPALRSHTVLKVARGLTAFLKLDAGLVRGAVPDFEQMLEQAQNRIEQRDRELRETYRKLKEEHRRLAQAHRELEETHRGLEEAHQELEQAHRELEDTRRRLSDADDRADTEVLSYEAAWEALIQSSSPDVAIGATRPFDLIGRMALAVLKEEGLKPTATLVDLGCGSGRLAVHAIPYLVGGHYIGIDISRTMLDEARERVKRTVPDPPGRVSWIHQTTPVFALDADSVDMICAFSVFTHMEHEDTYLYLKEALRVVRPGGRFVFSCVPVSTTLGEETFLASAGRDLQARYRTVRHVATSRELMDDIARLAGWTPIRWHDADEKYIQLPDDDEPHKFRQTVSVLEAPGT